MCLVRAFLALLICHSFKEVCLCGGGGRGEEKIALVQELFSQQIFSPEFDSGVHC